MGFKTFIVPSKTLDGTGIAVSLKKMGKGNASLGMTFRPAVVDGLGWHDGDKCEVAIGEDEHHGLIRLRPNPGGSAEIKLRQAGNAKGKRGGPYFAITLGHVEAFVNRSEPKRWVQFEVVDDGWLEIVLPRWADETGPKGHSRERVAPPAPLLVPPAPKPTGEQITRRLAGDPDPGRSALSNLSEADKKRLKIRA